MVVAVLAALVATGLVAGGTPVLRHDWPPPLNAPSQVFGSATGWDALGLGSPVGYPTSFMVVFARAAVAWLAGTLVAHIVFMAATWALLATGARALAANAGAPPLARGAAVVVAIFNPWTYTQLVAGHLYILVAYGATYWLAAESSRMHSGRWSPRPLVLVALVLAFAPQIQFLVLDGCALAAIALRARLLRPLIALGLFGVLVVVTVALTRESLLGIPLTLTWERNLSVEPLDALLLRGYFTGYSAGIDGIGSVAIAATLALALAAVALRPGRRVWSALATLVILAFVTGTKGPVALPFIWLLSHVPEIGLFRELYDLLGFAAVAYVALGALATATPRLRPLAALWLLAALAGPLAWFTSPPARWWVAAETVPDVAHHVADHERYALIPPATPLRLGDRGSGLDPDVVRGSGDTGPLNEYVMTYPVTAAFGAFLRSHDGRRLAALGVAEAVVRPWLETDPSIVGGLAFPPEPWLLRARSRSVVRFANVTPALTLGDAPSIGSMLAALGRGNVQLGDAAPLCGTSASAAACAAQAPVPVRPAEIFVAASADWVDARLAFLEAPELAQSYGGAVTTSAAATLPLVPDEDTLVWVRGRLVDATTGALVARGAGRYRWVHLAAATHAVRCYGRCVVAAQTRLPAGVPLEPPARRTRAIAFDQLLPWLAVASLEPGPAATLRYDVRFDQGWRAYSAGALLPHLRIDATTNGWLVPRRAKRRRVVIIETGAVITTAIEGLTLFGFVVLLAPAVPRLVRRLAWPYHAVPAWTARPGK